MSASMGFVEFGRNDIDNAIAAMSAHDIDCLPFDAIQLNSFGKILQYNVTEGHITGSNPKFVIGKDFFSEVAPCTNTAAFGGVFRKGVRDGTLNTIFEYTFDYNMTPMRVKIHMKKALVGETYWVFVKRL